MWSRLLAPCSAERSMWVRFEPAGCDASLIIVLGYTSNPRLDIIRRSRHWAKLFGSFTASLRWSGYGTVTSVVAMLVDRDNAANLAAIACLAIVLAVSVIVSAACCGFFIGSLP
jgi:hypothetical protein